MPTVVLAWDRPGPEPARLRRELLAAHLAHVERVMDHILVAGPLTDASGVVTGSLLVFDTADEAAARTLMDDDPYTHGGIWDRVEVRGFAAVAGGWVGGRTW